MESLRSFSSRLLVGTNDDEEFKHIPEEEEQRWAIQKCMELNEYEEESTVIMWIKKIKQSERKQQRRLMVITDVRLFTARRGGSKKKPKFEIRREAHILSLSSVQAAGLVIHIHFRDFELSFECCDEELTHKILGQLYTNYTFFNPGFSPQIACKWLDQYSSSIEGELMKKYPVIGDSLAPWERPARAFRSWAYFYKEPNKDMLSQGLRSILRRPLNELVVDDERWLHTKSLGCQNSKSIHGAVLCVAFTLGLLHGVEISDVKGDADLFFAVQTLLKYNTTLTSLVLDGCCDGPEWGTLMVNALTENPDLALKRFGLRNCKIGDKGVSYMIEGGKKLQRYPKCIYLTKANCSTKMMVVFLRSLPGDLEELDISDNLLETKGTMMLATRLMKDFQSLKMLNVERCNIDCRCLLNAIDQASTKGTLALQELVLSYNKMTTQNGLELSRILAETGTCASLGLAGCGLSGPTIASCLAALLSNESLKYYVRLDISDNNIGCDAAIMFASIFVFTDRIMSLKLNNCELSHEGMGYILHSLLTQPRLKLLEMDCNCKRTEWNSGKYQVSAMLRKLLEKCLNLERLSLRSDPERAYQVDLDQFLLALKSNDALTCLDLSGNSMTTDNLAALKDVVIRNETLRELYWDQNNVTSKHILGIIHALKQNKGLQVVQFPERDFQAEYEREKSVAKRMELTMMKKNFYRAVYQNATTQGFQQTVAKFSGGCTRRNSFLADQVKNETYQPQVGANSLGLPRFVGNEQNAMMAFPDAVLEESERKNDESESADCRQIELKQSRSNKSNKSKSAKKKRKKKNSENLADLPPIPMGTNYSNDSGETPPNSMMMSPGLQQPQWHGYAVPAMQLANNNGNQAMSPPNQGMMYMQPMMMNQNSNGMAAAHPDMMGMQQGAMMMNGNYAVMTPEMMAYAQYFGIVAPQNMMMNGAHAPMMSNRGGTHAFDMKSQHSAHPSGNSGQVNYV